MLLIGTFSLSSSLMKAAAGESLRAVMEMCLNARRSVVLFSLWVYSFKNDEYAPSPHPPRPNAFHEPCSGDSAHLCGRGGRRGVTANAVRKPSPAAPVLLRKHRFQSVCSALQMGPLDTGHGDW